MMDKLEREQICRHKNIDFLIAVVLDLDDRIAELEKQNGALRGSLKNYAEKKQIDNSKKLWRK